MGSMQLHLKLVWGMKSQVDSTSNIVSHQLDYAGLKQHVVDKFPQLLGEDFDIISADASSTPISSEGAWNAFKHNRNMAIDLLIIRWSTSRKLQETLRRVVEEQRQTTEELARLRHTLCKKVDDLVELLDDRLS